MKKEMVAAQASDNVTVLVVDDDAFNREGLRLYLERRGCDVLEAGDVKTAWEQASTHIPEVAILDIVVPPTPDEKFEMNRSAGIRLAQRLKRLDPTLGIVFFSAHEDRGAEMWEMIKEGKRGIVYKLKGCQPSELLNAIQEALAGRVSIDPDVITNPQSLVNDLMERLTPAERPWIKRVVSHLDTLTTREMEIAQRVAAAHTTEGIAQSLDIAPKTVETHVTHVYAKLGLRDMADQTPYLRQAVVLAKAFMLRELQAKG